MSARRGVAAVMRLSQALIEIAIIDLDLQFVSANALFNGFDYQTQEQAET